MVKYFIIEILRQIRWVNHLNTTYRSVGVQFRDDILKLFLPLL